VCLLVVSGCVIPERDYTGPTIQMQLVSNGFDTVQSDEATPTFQLGTDTQYSIDVEVFTYQGTATDAGTTSSSHVTSLSTSFSLGGMDQPVDLTSDHSSISATYTSRAPLVIPGTAKGGSLAVHASATDNNGVRSNVLDFSIALE
jgi:hypothetical protein